MQAQVPATQKGQEILENGIDSISSSEDHTDQYLTFIMADEEYGVDILCVQEIRGWESATPIPNAPAHVRGVINLRGTIVPIIDLRLCFGMDDVEYNAITVVIVLKVKTENGDKIMGVVVDAVSDVYSITEKEMRAAPDLGNSIDTEFIKGLVNVNDKMVILLNIDKLLTSEDLSTISDITDTAKALEN